MKKIESLQNPLIKHITKLYTPAYRKEHKECIAQNYTVCKMLYDHHYELKHLCMTEKNAQLYKEEFPDDRIYIVSDTIIKKISNNVTPSGIVGVFAVPEKKFTPTNNALVLCDLQDPGNVGTLIRTAAAMGIENIFTIQGVDCYSPKVIASSAGTIALVTIIPTTWQSLKKDHQDFTFCALVVDGGDEPEKLHLLKSIIVIGNEGAGLPDSVIKDCQQKLTIPMPGKTESLNAAVAGSIALYLKTKKDLA